MNGWPSDVTTDKYRIRLESLLGCELDIIGIAETHLRGDIVPVLDGYTAYTHNRQHLHRNAKCGFGCVCLFIKNVILESYKVIILDNKVEDILWLQLSHKTKSEVWGYTNAVHLDPIIKIQKKIVRTITFSHYLAHTEPIFDTLNILNFNNLVVHRISLMMLKYSKGLVPLPIVQLFTRNYEFHNHFTRQSQSLHTS